MGAAQRTGRVDGLAMLLAYRTCFARGRTVQRVTLLVAQIHSNNCYTYSGDTPSRTFNMNMMDSNPNFHHRVHVCMYVTKCQSFILFCALLSSRNACHTLLTAADYVSDSDAFYIHRLLHRSQQQHMQVYATYNFPVFE